MSKYSEHTKLGWSLGVLSVFFGIYIGLTYLLPGEDMYFAWITIAEGFFALAGLLFLDKYYGKKVQFKPDHFKPPEPDTLLHTVYILGALAVFQILIMQIPLTVRTWHRALAIMFAGPSEELFFRGLLFTPFIIWGKNDTKFKVKNPFGGRNKYWLEISLTEISGIIISSIMFMMLHINYYGDTKLLVTVFGSGIILGLFYQKYKNLTANILAHFVLNFIFVFRSYWMISF